NGGKSFDCITVPQNEKADFRSIYAFDSRKAIIANVGSPAKIFLTEDGGKNWQEVYVNNHKDAFIDGIDFWNEKTGIAFGDPIDGKLLLLKTNDGGKTWSEFPEESIPEMENGEASFAASGTTIRCFENGKVIIATGGKVSRLLVSENFGETWNTVYTPIMQGESSTGIFSFDFINTKDGIIVGGDYKNDSLTTDHVFYTTSGGVGWQRPAIPTLGYRECVMFVNDTIALATGPTGIDITYDAGNYWEPVSDLKNFHTIRKSKKGDLIVLSGKTGKIATMSAKALTEVK
ncbi:MAG TPA: YCF48-related protein, partial [Bacteroidia bacterium]|nr:YCF48-related protein [Bacteroidia bacterium]